MDEQDVEQEPQEERPPVSELLSLVMMRDQVQRLRIAEGNRALALEKAEATGAAIHRGYEIELHRLEKKVENQVRTEMEQHPTWPWLKEIRGVGALSAALVVSQIDITRCPTVSALWRFAGWGVVDGKRERPTKGEKRPYNARLKVMTWRVVDLQVKTRGPYRDVYDDAKHTYRTTRDDWTLGHCEAAARRKAAKMFLSHLWEVWREAEGLPVRSAFIDGAPGHRVIGAWEFLEKARDRREAREAAL